MVYDAKALINSAFFPISTHIKLISNHFKFDKLSLTTWASYYCRTACLCHSESHYLSPWQDSFIPLLTCPLLSPLTFTCFSRNSASMKVMDLNQQPIVPLCKWACAGVYCGHSYVWACVQGPWSFISRIHSGLSRKMPICSEKTLSMP